MSTIEHPGIVKEIKDTKTIVVSIISTSACSHCDSKIACTLNLSEIKEKEVDVEANPYDFPVGTKVIVEMPTDAGGMAIILSYVVPLVLLMIVLVVAYQLTANEALAGLLGLFSLVPYYFVLYLANKKIKEKIKFRVRKC